MLSMIKHRKLNNYKPTKTAEINMSSKDNFSKFYVISLRWVCLDKTFFKKRNCNV